MESRHQQWLENLRDERDGAALYEGLAHLEPAAQRSKSFLELAQGERRHATLWAHKLESEGIPLPADEPSARVRLLLLLARRLGIGAVMSLVQQAEATDADKYARQGGDAAPLAREEEDHRKVLAQLSGPAAGGAAGAIARRERWHRGGRAGSLRAAVFGINDGLVSNLSLLLGVAAAGAQQGALLITGFAGLLAGACSMAVGEFVSVASQRDLLARQVELERRELAEAPEEEAAELALIFQQKGLSSEQVMRTTGELLKNPEAALDTLVREELGLDPSDLGSPWGAALSSFFTFALGAVLPIVPFLFANGWLAMAVSAGAAFAVLAGVGGLLGFLSGLSPWRAGLRMAALAALAAGITVGLGRLLGTQLG